MGNGKARDFEGAVVGTKTVTAAEFKKMQSKGKRPWIQRSQPQDRTVEGIVFASKAESWRYVTLCGMRARKEIDGFACQPMLPLAGVKYTADFLVWKGGLVWLEDTKGRGCHEEVLRRFRRNQKQVKELYGLEVKLVEVEA